MKNHISSIHEREGSLKCKFSKKMSSWALATDYKTIGIDHDEIKWKEEKEKPWCRGFEKPQQCPIQKFDKIKFINYSYTNVFFFQWCTYYNALTVVQKRYIS